MPMSLNRPKLKDHLIKSGGEHFWGYSTNSLACKESRSSIPRPPKRGAGRKGVVGSEKKLGPVLFCASAGEEYFLVQEWLPGSC